MRIARICSLLLLLAAILLASQAGKWLSLPGFSGSAFAQQSQKQDKPRVKRNAPEGTPEEGQDNPQGKTAISVSVDLVSMNVLVTDQKSNVVTGLKAENFTVYEDNVKQEITHFAPVEANITVVMLVEYSKQIQYFVYDVWNAIYGFASTLRKGDWVAVIGYDMRPTILCDFTQDRNKLNEALARFNYPAFSESNLADALIDTFDRTEEIEGKVAVLLVSTGKDTFSRHTYDEALNKAKSANASVYAISLGQLFRLKYEQYMGAMANMDWLMADNRLRSFAEFTGGEAFFPRFQTELPSIFNSISAQLRNQYSIGYASTNTRHDGKFRKLRVDVSADLTEKGKPVKFKVLTRKGYLAKEN